MADNYLITGYWGKPHVTSENNRGIQGGIAGAGRYVLPVGNQFRAEFIGNNTIRMFDGKLMDNGAAAGIPAGEYVDFKIANAGQGLQRNDLIVFQYSHDASTMVETGSFVVIQGTEAATAVDPTPTQQDLLSGSATGDQMPLWRVSVSAVDIAQPVPLFEVSQTLREKSHVNHGHGNITTDGGIGTAQNRIITTGAGGVLQASTQSEVRSLLGLAKVATSGEYADLKNKPVIDSTVTAGGTNAVNSAAVIAYVTERLNAITDFEGSEF